MKYSIVITDYDPENRMVEMRKQCMDAVMKYTPSGAEIILATEKGLHSSINRAFKRSTGDYIALMGNDLLLRDPDWIFKLTVPHGIGAWKQVPFVLTGEMQIDLSLCCFARDAWEKLGGLDERFEGGHGYDDNDLVWRAKDLGIPMEAHSVNAVHLESQTIKTYHDDEKRKAMFERNKKLFEEKWHERLASRS